MRWLLSWVTLAMASAAALAAFIAWRNAHRSLQRALLAMSRLDRVLRYRVVVTPAHGLPDRGGNVVDMTVGTMIELADAERDLVAAPPLVAGHFAVWVLQDTGRALPRLDPGGWRRPGPAPARDARTRPFQPMRGIPKDGLIPPVRAGIPRGGPPAD